jgi:hypothetical protein
MTRKLLMLSFEKGVSYFFEEIMNKEIAADEDLKIRINQLICLDENGLFTQVMLREIKEKGKLMLGKTDLDNFHAETKAFVDFLYELAARDAGDDTTPLAFNGKFYKTAILLVAKTDTLFVYGLDSYIKRFSQNVREGIENIYISARNKNQNIAIRVFDKIKESFDLTSHKEFKYEGRNKQGAKFQGISIFVKINQQKNAKKAI